MAPASPSARRTPTGRRRGLLLAPTTAVRPSRSASLSTAIASEPPPKRRRFVPGGPGGGGKFVDVDDMQQSPQASGAASVSRTRSVAREAVNGATPSLLPRRERSTRIRGDGGEELEEMRWGSAAAMAASVKQAEDYKPREERSWEEFHPHLDIEGSFLVLRADEVDGLPQEPPATPVARAPGTPLNGSSTPSKQTNPASAGNTPNGQPRSEANPPDTANGTPSRRSRRSTQVVNFYTPRAVDSTPRTPKILPIQNQTPKERLDLKLPSYRKTNRIELFESKTFGQARYVDKAMSSVGYQESDHFPRPDDNTLIKAVDGIFDDDLDPSAAKPDSYAPHSTRIGRVEYDMDEQDDMWLEQHNALRKQSEENIVTREVFEITMTKIEKEWHALEKRIPKPNPKPPQTHRPRSSSAAAVNGEPGAGDEPDSKCAICDDGDCENTNAIVFCDGCNLAVHQECYGVPFIPEGQWLCRKCQLCGRGVPTCIFCPNTDGAFKQTNSSKWAHLFCAMWIPEVSLGNHTFMEPVMDVEKVPKNRWKLSCYICNQRMGACIQCSNKNCYQAFHVTCARRARLFLKMKTSQGQLAVLDGSMVLKAFCDKHCSLDHAKENDVYQATRSAKKFYRRNMRGRIWADNQAMANVMAAQHRNAITAHPANESQLAGAQNLAALADKKDKPGKNVWRLPSGAPIIPHAVFEIVEASIQRFPFSKRKNFLSEACRYWTLKREARRGAALLKRLQLQMESFSSMELTRRNFASMGASGRARLARRIQFAENLIHDLGQLTVLADDLVEREKMKLHGAELEQEFVDECYFPVAKLLSSAADKALALDKSLTFSDGLARLQARVEDRYYVTALPFAHDMGDVINDGIHTDIEQEEDPGPVETNDISPSKRVSSDIRARRALGRRILKAVQSFLETALRIESEISQKPYEALQKELEAIYETSTEGPPRHSPNGDADDTIMQDAPDSSDVTVKNGLSHVDGDEANEDAMDVADADAEGEEEVNMEVDPSALDIANEDAGEEFKTNRRSTRGTLNNGVASLETPPDTNDYESIAQPVQPGPPTPPQSNGSLGQEPLDPMADGGVLWYLKAYQPRGTSILGEHWAGRDAVRMLSEDLTDLDDEELKGLGADVDTTFTAAAAASLEADDKVETLTPNSARNRASKVVKKRRVSGRRR